MRLLPEAGTRGRPERCRESQARRGVYVGLGDVVGGAPAAGACRAPPPGCQCWAGLRRWWPRRRSGGCPRAGARPPTPASARSSASLPGGLAAKRRGAASPSCSTAASAGSPPAAQSIGQGWPRLSTEAAVCGLLENSAELVQPWREGAFQYVRRLQEAERNKGSVDLMRCKGFDAAVKRMPSSWTRGSAAGFDEKYPTSTEKPWMDIAIVTHLNDIGYPYVCGMLGVFEDATHTYVASSLATEGDLFAWCDRGGVPRPRAGSPERERAVRPLAAQVFQAVRWLHELGISHRDLSLENILLTQSAGEPGGLQVKIIDFGMATMQRFVRNEVRGKEAYFAPEMHVPHECMDTFLADSFALGVVLFAMASQDYPWTSTRPNKCGLFQYVSMFGLRRFLERRPLRNGGGEKLAEVFSGEFVEVIEGLLRKEPRGRMSLGESCLEGGSPKAEGARQSVWATEWMKAGWAHDEAWATFAVRSPQHQATKRWLPPSWSTLRLLGA